MPIVIAQFPAGSVGRIIGRRILIGRRADNDLVLDDPAVSRIHASIMMDNGLAVLTDHATRTGTFVNETRISGPLVLSESDQIRIGRTVLVYHDADALPDGVAVAPSPAGRAQGITFYCTCDHLIWVPTSQAGHAGVCGQCGRNVVVPLPDSDLKIAGEEPQAPALGDICGICQCKVRANEPTTACPGCGLVFHAECWIENRGCAAYGCSHVNALADDDDASALGSTGYRSMEWVNTDEDHRGDVMLDEASTGVSWDMALLAGSLFGAVVGLATFGVTALAVGAWAIKYLIGMKGSGAVHGDEAAGGGRARVRWAVAISLIAVPVGVMVSMALWLKRPIGF